MIGVLVGGRTQPAARDDHTRWWQEDIGRSWGRLEPRTDKSDRHFCRTFSSYLGSCTICLVCFLAGCCNRPLNRASVVLAEVFLSWLSRFLSCHWLFCQYQSGDWFEKADYFAPVKRLIISKVIYSVSSKTFNPSLVVLYVLFMCLQWAFSLLWETFDFMWTRIGCGSEYGVGNPYA